MTGPGSEKLGTLLTKLNNLLLAIGSHPILRLVRKGSHALKGIAGFTRVEGLEQAGNTTEQSPLHLLFAQTETTQMKSMTAGISQRGGIRSSSGILRLSGRA